MADFVDAEPLVPVMNIAEHPEVILSVINPVSHMLLREGLSVLSGVRVTMLQVRQDPFIELLGINRIGEGPFNDMVMGFQLLGPIGIE